MLVSFNSNTTSATCGTGTVYPSGAPEYIPGFSGIPVAQCLLNKVIICRSLFVFLSFVDWPVYCLFFDLRLLITPLITFIVPIYLPATNILVVWRNIMIYINVHIVLCQDYSLIIKHSNCKNKMTLINETQISNLMRKMRFWYTIHQVRSKSKDWKTSTLKFWEQYNQRT